MEEGSIDQRINLNKYKTDVKIVPGAKKKERKARKKRKKATQKKAHSFPPAPSGKRERCHFEWAGAGVRSQTQTQARTRTLHDTGQMEQDITRQWSMAGGEEVQGAGAGAKQTPSEIIKVDKERESSENDGKNKCA